VAHFVLPFLWFAAALICAWRIGVNHFPAGPEHGQKVSRRHFSILALAGVISYLLQLTVHVSIERTPEYFFLAPILTTAALGCFLIVTSDEFRQRFDLTHRDIFQMCVWGQMVFPLSLLALPEFIRIIGFQFG